MKKNYFILIMFLIMSIVVLGKPASTGFTGLIDFPSAYNLRINNYSVTGLLDHLEGDSKFGIMLEGGFIPQIEAGIKLSSEDKLINQKLLKANFKFQFVQEADNPAMAIGFVEDEDVVYGYLVASKSIRKLLDKKIFLDTSIGLKYDENSETSFFIGLGFPIFQKIKLLSEVYSYNDVNKLGEKEKKISYNIGGEFYTTGNVSTKVFWREIDDSVGIAISYTGIHN